MPLVNRRTFLAAAGAVVAPRFGRAVELPSPATGAHDALTAPLDELMTGFVAKHRVPGATLAVARFGRLVYSRGFGWADRQNALPALPQTLFRIASISKPITAAAILRLVDHGKLKLDDPAFGRLDLKPHLEAGATVDPRVERITVRHLLQHTGGWDRQVSFDAMFRSVQIAADLKVPAPAGAVDVIRWVMGRKLDFDPGSRYAYSNLGYCVLGRIIEKLTGTTYAEYVRKHVLEPLGVHDMRIGRTLPSGRAPGETKYYEDPRRTGKCVFAPDVGKPVPPPYGAWHLEAMDSHGAWIASAAGLLRFARAFEHRSPVLSQRAIAEAFARPQIPRDPKTPPGPVWYGLGWQVRDVGGGSVNTWHTGSLDGTSTILVRRFDGLSWAVLFNTRGGADGRPLSASIDPEIHRAVGAIRDWPAGEDLSPSR